MHILDKLFKPAELLSNPSSGELRKLARCSEINTAFGSAAYITKIRNRSAKFTQVVGEDISRKEVEPILDNLFTYLQKTSMIQMDRSLCQNNDFQYACRLFVTTAYARIPYMWGASLFPVHKAEADFITITVPEWKTRSVLIFPEDGVTIILGTDYMGENKKSMLRLLMYHAKKRGALGLHAGSKLLRVKNNNRLSDKGFLFFGLSGTGKTSLSCHSHWLKGEEKVIIRQDDVVVLRQDGSVAGTENGFYIKTDALTAEDQPVIYAATISPRAIMENVSIDKATQLPDFADTELTSNGRAMVQRTDLAYTDNSVDLASTDCMIFITRRNTVVPPVARLTTEQAAAAFMLGESIETSAGDPDQAGQSKRVVGTNPFILGPLYKEGNIFLDILRQNPGIRCYMMNTGRVGMNKKFKGDKITLQISSRIIEMIGRDAITWKRDNKWGYELPVNVPGLDMRIFNPENYYDSQTYNQLCNALLDERVEWLSRFKGLYPEIVNTVTAMNHG